jgi:type IV pilus assembly protein PilM
MAGGYVGLDIGSNLIKVIEARGGNGRIEVVALGVDSTPQEAFDNGVIVDAQLLGKAVKDLLKKSGIGSNQVISSASSSASVVVRVIDVPKMNPAELAETMKWEMERQVPFAMSEVIMDYQPVERPEGVADGANMEVVLAVAQQDFIDRHVEVLQAAGLKPKYIDVEPLAAGRALLEIGGANHPAGYTVAIVNIGANNTDISIFRDKLLSFPRTLPLGGDNFTRAIADALQVDMATAETYKRDLGEVMFDQLQAQQQNQNFSQGYEGFMDFAPPPPDSGPTSSPSGRMPFDFSNPAEPAPPPPTPFDFGSGAPAGPQPGVPPADPGFFMPPDPSPAQPDFGAPAGNLPIPAATGDAARDALRIQIFNSIAPLLAEVVQELRRSLDYYRTKSGDAPVHEILLVGGSAKLRNLDRFLEAELGVPARVANPLQNVQVSSKNFSHEYLEDISSLFSVSLGLAAYDLVGVPAGGGKKKKK